MSSLQGFLVLCALQLASAIDLGVMSYNLYGWNALGQNSWKAANIFNKIKQYAPDIMGCQEVEGHAQWIVQETVDAAKGAFAVSDHHAGHSIFYRSATFEIEEQGHFDINEQDQWGLRRLAWVKFLHKPSGDRFLHFNSHWCVCGEPQLFQTARSVAQWIADVRARFSSLPVILTGDLNVFGGCHRSKAIRYLTGEEVDGQRSPIVFVDAHAGQGATFGGCKIDYVLLAGDWSVLQSVIDRDHRNGAIGSDHDSLYARLSMGVPTPVGPCEEGGAVWNTLADGFTCGARINWLSTHELQGDLVASKQQVAREFPDFCGACASGPLQPVTTTTPAATTTQTTAKITTTEEATTTVAVTTTTLAATTTQTTAKITTTEEATTTASTAVLPGPCEEGGPVWNSMANGHTCGGRIQWLAAHRLQGNTAASKEQVASEFPSICGACSSIMPCEEGGSVWNKMADGHSCGDRIQWLSTTELQGNVPAAKSQVALEYPSICGECASDTAPQCEGLQNVEKLCSSNGCKVLAGGMWGRTCEDYCRSHGFACKGAWEEENENCNVKAVMTCTEIWPGTSDLLCECEPLRRLSGSLGDWSVLV